MLKKMTRISTFIAITSGFFCSLNASYALHSSIIDAEQLKNKIIYNKRLNSETQNSITKKIVLPVSRGFDQGKTCLCWSYAFFNALETLYLVNHPSSQLEISRGAMQYMNLQDRIDLKIDGVEDHLDPKKYKKCGAEGGTALSAEYILKNYGAVPFQEYHDIISPPDYTNLYYSIFIDNTTPKQKRAITDSLLPLYFGADLPETINFNGQMLSRFDFAKEILPQATWTTYALSKDGSEYSAPGLDPDARRGEQTHFIAKDTLIEKINQSLANSRPIIYSAKNHLILIYGADYNKDDEPVSFYIKDNYERLGYFYRADFEKAINEMLEMTILEG
jgi:hypothetical protein